MWNWGSQKEMQTRKLLEAAQAGDAESAMKAIAAGADREGTAGAGRTALMIAAERGDAGMAEALLSAGVSPEARDIYGRTALMLAVLSGRAEALEALIRGGSDLEAEDRYGRRALHWATLGDGEGGCALRLLEAGASPAARDGQGRTARMLAADEGLERMEAELARWEALAERGILGEAAGEPESAPSAAKGRRL